MPFKFLARSSALLVSLACSAQPAHAQQPRGEWLPGVGGNFTNRGAMMTDPCQFVQPLPEVVYCPGTIEVGVVGDGPFTYEWYFGGELYSTQNEISITPFGMEPCFGGFHEVSGSEDLLFITFGESFPSQCRISGPLGVCEQNFELLLHPFVPPTHTSTIDGLVPSIVHGQTAVLSASFSNQTIQSMQWTRNGIPLADGPTGSGSSISTSIDPVNASATLTITNCGMQDTGLYVCANTYACGTSTHSTPLSIISSPSGSYLSQADSQFDHNDPSFLYFHLEDFEDGLLNTPGVTGNPYIVTSPSGVTDSVDADDGVIDGNGNAGRSCYAAGGTITFTFDACALGGLPTHAGLVWTDIGSNGGFGLASVYILGQSGEVIGQYVLHNFGDGNTLGGTNEDRFFGFEYLPGIAALRIVTFGDMEVDHLQYGSVVVTQQLPPVVYAPETIEVDVEGPGPFNYEWNISGFTYTTNRSLVISRTSDGCGPGLYSIDGSSELIFLQYGFELPVICTITSPNGSCVQSTMLKLACCGDIQPQGAPDGQINIDDLLLVIGSWGVCNSPCPADVHPVPANGVVNIDDLLFVIGQWGSCK